jgi:hypothetical protein
MSFELASRALYRPLADNSPSDARIILASFGCVLQERVLRRHCRLPPEGMAAHRARHASQRFEILAHCPSQPHRQKQQDNPTHGKNNRSRHDHDSRRVMQLPGRAKHPTRSAPSSGFVSESVISVIAYSVTATIAWALAAVST